MATLILAGVGLSLVFGSVAIGITPAIVIAGIVGYSVYQIQAKKRSSPV